MRHHITAPGKISLDIFSTLHYELSIAEIADKSNKGRSQ